MGDFEYSYDIALARIDRPRDELILARALVAENDWRALREADDRVQHLPQIPIRLPLRDGATQDPKLRSPGRVSLKGNTLTAAMKGGRLTREAVADFTDHPAEMLAAARALHAGCGIRRDRSHTDQEGEADTAREGRLRSRRAPHRERSRPLRDRKIRAVLEEGGTLHCEVCSFDFTTACGVLGTGYIEVHHPSRLSTYRV
ncbi:HNH endonuclease [Streptomyces sp. NPDC002516]